MTNKHNFPIILNTKYLILGLTLIISYFVSRLINLTKIPVFCDEAIYVRWAQVMRAVASLRFLPLSDGKQPLFMWLIIPFLKIISDPLIAGRMVSVLAGFGTMIGIGTLSYLLFKKKKVALFVMILYLITPFTIFFDRMALADGLLSMFGIWCLIFFILITKTQRLDVAMIAGILLGLGLITKSPAILFALMLPMTLIISGRNLLRPYNLVKTILLWGIVYFFAFAIYNILRLGPEFHMVAIRNKDYVYSFSEILKHPFNPLIGHLKDVVSWNWILLTPLIFLSGLVGIFLGIKRNVRPGFLILTWFVLSILGQSAIAKVFTSRYVLFTVPFFLIFSAIAIEEFFQKVRNKVLVVGGLVIVFFLPLYQSILLITNPQKAWLPANERSGYLEQWTAGYGIKESSEYIKEIAQTQKVLVGTEGFFGTLPNGLEMYLEKVPDITIIGVGYPIKEIPSKLTDGLKNNRVFLLANDSRFEITENPRLNLIKKFPKAVDSEEIQENLLFFEIR